MLQVLWTLSSKELGVLFAFQVSFSYLNIFGKVRPKDALCQKTVCQVTTQNLGGKKFCWAGEVAVYLIVAVTNFVGFKSSSGS